jgi:hypothetical protein
MSVGGELVLRASLRNYIEEYSDDTLCTGENQVGWFKMIFTDPPLPIA